MGVGRCLYGYCHQQDRALGKEFNRLLEDCNSRKIKIVITKNISRFGRVTEEILDVLKQLKTQGRVIFEQEELDIANTDRDLMISIIESLSQVENELRSDNIRWGIKQKAASGTSKLYDRKCYRNIFSVTSRNKMKAVALMLKAIHVQESKEAACEKALQVAEKQKAIR